MNPQEPEPLRIRQIRIDGLFGLYNHCINLNLKERVTILHGPNGVGKTVTLRMVEALLKGDYEFFFSYPFDKFIALFDNGTELTFIPKQQGTSKKITINLVTDSTTSPHSGDVVITKSRQKVVVYEPPWLTSFRSKNGLSKTSAYLITTQRLTGSRGSFISAVKDYSSNLKSIIEKTLAEYSQHAQTLDQSFPLRLLSISNTSSENTELKQRMVKLEIQRKDLQKIGLLDESPTEMFDAKKLDDLIAQEEKVMTLYVQDTEQKLGQLEDLARRCKLLLDNINSKFKNKRLHIGRQNGFVITNDANQILDLDSLSSGEQHEIVLLYDLLFRIKPNTLVLIDEPELSLHVSWQDHFLPDLLKIVEIAQFDVLIATHSPYIVGDYIDLMVALETGTKSV